MIKAIQRKVEISKSFLEQHKTLVPFVTFLAGFLFDIITLGRIDQWPVIVQQAVFILLSTAILITLFLKPEWKTPQYPKLEMILEFRMATLHFLFGSLLSSYTIFYFKSSSFSVSFFFLLVIAVLLIANEFPHFQKLGLGVKSALLGVCTLSYLSYLIPILFGVIGAGVFILSIIVGSLFLLLFILLLRKKELSEEKIQKQVFIPFTSVILVFLVTYFFKILPPVPLSLQYAGVYHTIEKTVDNKYKLGHLKPWWNFWSHGDQSFKAHKGDQIIVFFRLFAPSNFEEQVHLVWSLKNARGDWEPQDKIPIQISGGRGSGFRGYGVKSNFSEGDWKTTVITSDDREVGRIYFNVKSVTRTDTLKLKFDYH